MKIFKIIIPFILIIIILTIILNNNKKEVESINILNWSSYIPSSVINKFEKETGIKVNYSTYSSNEELLAKVSNVKQGTYDLVFPSDYMIEIMINKGLLEPLDKTKLSNYSNINNKYLNLYYDSNNSYSIPFLIASTVISYNRECNINTINSYNDLLNSEYKNNIVLLDDERIVIGSALLALGYDSNSTKKEELEEAYKWLNKLKNNVKAYDSDSPKNFLITNETCLGLIWNAEAVIANDVNNNIKYTIPKEGNMISIDNFAIVKNSKNIENTYKFINYILDTNAMKEIVDNYPYISANKYISSDNLNNYQSYFVKNVGENIKLFDDVWMRLK